LYTHTHILTQSNVKKMYLHKLRYSILLIGFVEIKKLPLLKKNGLSCEGPALLVQGESDSRREGNNIILYSLLFVITENVKMN